MSGNKLLIICGPTTTGKTKLAAHIAKKFNGELISADSRQVYRGLDIGTGKDVPDGVVIYGYDIANPKEDFSVAEYIKFARKTINKIWKAGKLPILVGGTGFYIKGVVDGIGTAGIPKNSELRKILEDWDTNRLYDKLAQLAPMHAAGMNSSDSKNPRRLVRAIEIAQAKLSEHSNESINRLIGADMLFVGLKASREKLADLIEKRVRKRLNMGLKNEIKNLLTRGVSWDSQAMSSLGYKEWKGYFTGNKTLSDVIDDWTRGEINYAKRQLVWFKRDSRINWYKTQNKHWLKNVEKKVKKWYSDTNE